MSLFQSATLNFLVETLLAEFLVTVAGVLVAQTIIRWWVNRRYGRWTLTVIKNEEKKLDQVPITPAKMKQITDVPEDMPVFLKGMCSPFHTIRCDLMRTGEALGVLQMDDESRKIVINLDKDSVEVSDRPQGRNI